MKHFGSAPRKGDRHAQAKPKSLTLGPTLAEKVADKRVTLLHLAIKGDHHRKRFVDGDTLPVRAYVGGPVVCHVLVQHVRRDEPASETTVGMPAPLGVPTTHEAHAAGFENAKEFMRAWVADRSAAWLAREHRSAGQVEQRFRDRHAHQPAWTLTVKVIPGIARGTFLLAGAVQYDPRRDPNSPLFDRSLEGRDTLEDHGYTTNPARALTDAGEVLTAEEYAAHVAQDAAERETARLRMVKFDRENTPREPRIAAARAAARNKGLDMRDEFRRLDRLIDRELSAEVDKQLALIEGRVFPRVAA